MPPVHTTGACCRRRAPPADRRRRRGVAAERPALVGNILRHALVAARSGIGIGRPADARLLGVVELAAARRRQKIHAGPGEGGAEKTASSTSLPPAMHSSARNRQPTANCLPTRGAPRQRLRAAAARDFRAGRHSRPRGCWCAKGTTPSCRRARSAVRRRRNRLLGAHRGIGKQTGKHLRQIADVRRCMSVTRSR